MQPHESTLIARIAQHDQAALQQLYDHYYRPLYSYLWHHLQGDSMLIDEAMQDIFVAIWRSAPKYRQEAQVKTWIFRIAHDTAFHLRRQLTLQQRLTSLPHEEDMPAQQHFASQEDEIIARIVLSEAMEQLSEKHQEVLVLFFQQGFTLAEVAHILNIPVGTVKSRLSYARQALLKQLSATTMMGE